MKRSYSLIVALMWVVGIAVQPIAAKASGFDVKNIRTYTYVFSGQATCGEKPCANVAVSVRVVSDAGSQLRQVKTNQDGKYELWIGIPAQSDGNLTWEVTAVSPQMQSVELAGRQIPGYQAQTVIDTPLAFAGN